MIQHLQNSVTSILTKLKGTKKPLDQEPSNPQPSEVKLDDLIIKYRIIQYVEDPKLGNIVNRYIIEIYYKNLIISLVYHSLKWSCNKFHFIKPRSDYGLYITLVKTFMERCSINSGISYNNSYFWELKLSPSGIDLTPGVYEDYEYYDSDTYIYERKMQITPEEWKALSSSIICGCVMRTYTSSKYIFVEIYNVGRRLFRKVTQENTWRIIEILNFPDSEKWYDI